MHSSVRQMAMNFDYVHKTGEDIDIIMFIFVYNLFNIIKKSTTTTCYYSLYFPLKIDPMLSPLRIDNPIEIKVHRVKV